MMNSKILGMATSAVAIQAVMATGALVASAVPGYAFSTTNLGGTTGQVTISSNLVGTTLNLAAITTLSVTISTSNTAVGTQITLTAPTGLNFPFAPAVACSGTSLNPVSFTSGSSSAVYTAGGVATCISGGSLGVSAIQLAGVNTFSSTFAALTVSSNATGELTITGATTGASNGALAIFTAPVSMAAATTSGGGQIDITLGATKFVSSTTGTVALTLGSITYGASQSAKDVDAATTVSLNSSSGTASAIAATGNFNGISSVYAATASSCATVAPSGAISGAPASGATTVALSGLTTTSSSTYVVCAIANGTTVLQPATFRLSLGGSLSNGATISSVTSSSASPATLSYGGNSTQLSYYVGSGSYTSYLNVTNANPTGSAVVYLVGVPAGGTQVVGVLDSALSANSNKLYTPAQVATAFGGTNPFTNSNGGRLQVLVSGASTSSVAQNLLLNPAGNVNQMP